MSDHSLTIDDPRYFERLAQVEKIHWWFRGFWRLVDAWLGHALEGYQEAIALDVGCGAGATLQHLRDRPDIAWVIGLDASLAALRYACRTGQPILRALATELPISSRSVDLVTCLDVLQHLRRGDAQIALREIKRVLRPGGFALIRSNGRGWLHEPATHIEAPPYRLKELVSSMEQCGFIIERATYMNCVPSILQEVVGRMTCSIGARDVMLPNPSGGGFRLGVPSPLRNRLMGLLATTEAILAGRLGVVLPFGHSTLVLARKPDHIVS